MIMARLQEHLDTAMSHYPEHDWFVICLQGSQNYGIADADSDIDSKLLLIPSFESVALNKKPISHTVVMENNEHCDVKDVREYFKIFRKSNINFVEILFTDYWIVNERYEDLWLELRRHAEELARYNSYAAVACMKGMAYEKFHALCHRYPSRAYWIDTYGFDPKQLSHLIRIKYFIDEYVAGGDYKNCLFLEDSSKRERLLQVKRTGLNLTKESAIELAQDTLDCIVATANKFQAIHPKSIDREMDKFLNDLVVKVLERSVYDRLHYR